MKINSYIEALGRTGIMMAIFLGNGVILRESGIDGGIGYTIIGILGIIWVISPLIKRFEKIENER